MDDNPAIHEDYRKIIGAATGGAPELADLEAEIFGDSDEGPTRASYFVTSAYQGKEALEIVRAAKERGEPFSMVFMDVRMPPGWNGIETTKRIWEVDPDLEVVICTAYSDCGWSDIVGQLGATDQLLILKKPFDAMEVQQLAHALTEKWYLRRKAALTLDQVTKHLDLETSRRQQVEVELRHAQKLEAVGRLAAGLSHELNTPLQFAGDNAVFLVDAMGSLLELVAEYRAAVTTGAAPAALQRLEAAEASADLEYLQKQIPEAASDLQQGLQRVAATVKALRNFSSINQPDKTYVDLNNAVRDTVTVAEHELRDIAEVELDLNEMPQVLCRPGDVNQVLLSLITNAAQAMADARKVTGTVGRLRIHTATVGEHIEIAVSDTGVGIPESARDHVFEPFFTTREVGKGAGLGLSVAHGIIVKGHGGTIDFTTDVGMGTTFRVTLPLKSKSLVAEAGSQAQDRAA